MRSWLKLSTVSRCLLCQNVFRAKSSVTPNVPFLKVVTDSTVIGRPIVKDKNVFVQHPVYSGLQILVSPLQKRHDPFSLVEVEVEPLGNWLMKRYGVKEERRVTVAEFFSSDEETLAENLCLDKVYLSNLEDHLNFFRSVIPVGRVNRTLSSLRPDDVWHFGGMRAGGNGDDATTFSPDLMLEPDKRVNVGSSDSSLLQADVKHFFNVSRKKFATQNDLPPEKIREKKRKELLERYSITTKSFEDDESLISRRSHGPKEWVKRRDFRNECVLSIDPPTARDLDDALHIRSTGKDRFEVGVHIADVGFYVPSKSRLCNIAMQRGTSIYLGDEVIPMLPPALSEDLCSLHPGKPKLTMSVVFELDSKGKVLSYWIGETVIESCAKLTYTQANDMIDTKTLPADVEIHKKNPEAVIASVRSLHMLAMKLRKERVAKGAITFNMSELKPVTAEDEKAPIAFHLKQYGKSSILIEEFMLLANMTVAKFLQAKMPNQAVLRSHPMSRNLGLLYLLLEREQQEVIQKSGLSAGLIKKVNRMLLEKFAGLKSETCVSDLEQVLSFFVVNAMNPAEYKVAQQSSELKDYFHFGLQVPLYTHFTSPIRRFSDLVVHYQLKSLLQMVPPPDRFFLTRAVAISNQKRTASRRLSREMNRFHVWNALMATGSVVSLVYVTFVQRKKIVFYCPTFEVAGEVNIGNDKSVLNAHMVGQNHLRLLLAGCYSCNRKIPIDVKPLTELHCFLTPGHNMEINGSLAHTITCPDCFSRISCRSRKTNGSCGQVSKPEAD